MKKLNLFSTHPLVRFSIVVFDLLSLIIFVITIIKNDKIMNLLNIIWNNIEIILIIIAVIITVIYILYFKRSEKRKKELGRHKIIVKDLIGLNIRLKLLQATYNSIDMFRKRDACPDEIRKLMTDDEILKLDEYGYSKESIDKILNAVEFKPINK